MTAPITGPSGPASLEAAILEQAADAIIFADRQGVVRLWNRGAETAFGWSAAEALGQGLDFIIPERLRPAHNAGFERAIASGQVRNAGHAVTTRAVGKGGARLYMAISFSLVKDASGAVLGAVAIGRLSPPPASASPA
jgi:PAS domain S-box-containing protein